MLLLLKAY
ncbi:uncharacterized protein FFC1_12454 [Fusarium fujikuroi]|nr:uncharacterized protein FFC1_12454 [Fusarium fujikuroi]